MSKAITGAVKKRLRAGARRRRLLRSGVIGAAATALAIAASPATAQISSTQSGSSSVSYMDYGEAMQTLTAFGSCYALRRPRDAQALLATEPASQVEAAVVRTLFRDGAEMCVGNSTNMRLPIAFVRGAIAEGLYKRNVALPPELVQVAVAPADVRSLADVARCYVHRHRDKARTLIDETRAGSRREYEALTEMAPDIFGCIPGTGQNRALDPVQIRYRLVEALYRMPAAAPASVGQE